MPAVLGGTVLDAGGPCLLDTGIVGADPMLMRRRIKGILFSTAPEELAGLNGFLTKVGQVIYLAVRKFRKDFCIERAASLTFFSIISLIPLTVLFFSIARTMGEGERIKGWFIEKIPKLLAPGQKEKLSAWLREDIGTDAFMPDSSGLVNFTAVCGLIMISLGIYFAAERVFNHIWQVQQRRNRLQRLVVFWVILTTSPLLAVASLWAEDMLPAGGLKSFLRDSATFAIFLGFLAFTLMYLFLPAVKVRISSAALGGLVTALLWQLSKYGFSYYLVGVDKVTHFYDNLRAVPLFLVWLYVTWLVILWGAQISFVHQNRVFLARLSRENTGDGKRSLAALGFYLLYRVGTAFRTGGEIPSLKEVTRDLGMTRSEGVERAAEVLLKQGVLLGDGALDSRHTLACDPGKVVLAEVAALLRAEEFPGECSLPAAEHEGEEGEAEIRRLIAGANASWEESFEARTLADILPAEAAPKDDQVTTDKRDMELG